MKHNVDEKWSLCRGGAWCGAPRLTSGCHVDLVAGSLAMRPSPLRCPWSNLKSSMREPNFDVVEA